MKSLLKAGAAEVEITPPLAVGFLASSVEKRWQPFRSVRKGLKASIVAFELGSQRVVLCATDLLGFACEAVYGWERFVSSICAQTGVVAPEELILTATHTHSAPETLGLTDCYHTPGYQAWLEQLEAELARGVRCALERLTPATLSTASGRTEGLTVYRRIKTAEGIRMSSTLERVDPAITRRNPTDERLRVLSVRSTIDGAPVAFIAHAVCHPVYEMCIPEVSPDYPGEFASLVQERTRPVPVLFLNGAAGPVNPWQVSGGVNFSQRHASELFRAFETALTHPMGLQADRFFLRRERALLSCRKLPGEVLPEKVEAECAMLSFPGMALLFLPGEVFLETALNLERKSPFAETWIIGYSNRSIGYIPTPTAFDEGGYEIGPGRWSYLTRDAEPLLAGEALKLLQASPTG